MSVKCNHISFSLLRLLQNMSFPFRKCIQWSCQKLNVFFGDKLKILIVLVTKQLSMTSNEFLSKTQNLIDLSSPKFSSIDSIANIIFVKMQMRDSVFINILDVC